MPIYKMEGKKDGLQKYRVRINYTDHAGNARQIDRVAYGAAAARLLESELQRELKSAAPASNLTIQELCDEYLEAKSHEVRASTLGKSECVLSHHVLPYLKDTKLSKLDKKALQSWKNKISEKTLSIKMKQNIYKEFRTLLNYALKVEYITKNPITDIGNFRDPYTTPSHEKIKYYTPSQFIKYIAVARDSAVTLTDWGFYVFFCIAYYTGMRKGEINALTWSDIDGEILHVRRSVAQKIKGQSIIETPPKNKSSYRDLQIPKPLLKILAEHKKRQMRDDHFSDDFRVCGGIKCLSDTAIENKNKLFAKAAGLPHIRIHDFRHSHASLLANEGINIQEIARRLGHSDVKMTWNTYAHLYPREEERAVSVLDRINVYETCTEIKKPLK